MTTLWSDSDVMSTFINSRKPSLLESRSERLCVRAQQEMESLLNSVRERERADWFSEETTGYPTPLYLSDLLKWSRNPFKP